MTFPSLPPRLRRLATSRLTLGVALAWLSAPGVPAASPAPPEREASAPDAPATASAPAAPAAAPAASPDHPTGSGSRSAETNAPSRLDFSAFRIISERNIFNPNRTARSTERPTRETRRAPRVESFSLVGTMSYAKGAFAFFDGSSSDLRKSLAPGGTIAGYTVREIQPTGVKLEGHGSTLELPVSGQLRREDEGEWQVASSGDRPSYAGAGSSGAGEGGGSRGGGRNGGGSRRASGSSGGSGAAADSGTDSASGSGGGASDADVNEVLRKLMEQREKELK